MDKFLISSHLTASVISCDIRPCVLSDHDFVALCFDQDTFNPRGPGVWKFNNSILNNEAFVSHACLCIADLAGAVDLFPSKKMWDFFKESIQAEAISFSSAQRRQLSHDRVSLTNRLVKLKQKLSRGNESVIPDISSIEAELRVFIVREWEGVKVRSKACWLEEGELPTHFSLT